MPARRRCSRRGEPVVAWDDGRISIVVPGPRACSVPLAQHILATVMAPYGVTVAASAFWNDDGQPEGFAETAYGAVPIDNNETGYKILQKMQTMLKQYGYRSVRVMVEGDE